MSYIIGIISIWALKAAFSAKVSTVKLDRRLCRLEESYKKMWGSIEDENKKS